MWGFSVEAELIENADRQDELCCYVSRVEEKSVAMQNGKLYLGHISTGPVVGHHFQSQTSFRPLSHHDQV